MGKVIKKDEDQSDITTAPLDENLREERPAGTSGRIPASQVSSSVEGSSSRQGAVSGHAPTSDQASTSDQSDGDRQAGQSEEGDKIAHGGVLKSNQSCSRGEPVTVEPPTPLDQPSSGHYGSNTDACHAKGGDGEKSEQADADSDEAASEMVPAERLEERLEEARREGYEEGFADGKEEGHEIGWQEAENSLRSELEKREERLAGDLSRFEELWNQFFERKEKTMVQLALDLAETVAGAPLTGSVREVSKEALASAVQELGSPPQTRVTVSPEDHERLVDSGFAKQIGTEVQLKKDPGHEQGDWTVSTQEETVRRRQKEVVSILRNRLREAARRAGKEDSRSDQA